MRSQPDDLDYQDFPRSKCLVGGLITAIRRLPPCPSLPIGRLNITHHNGENGQVRTFVPRNRGRYALQVAQRPDCGYGHYMLLLVEGDVAYLYDPDGRNYKHIPWILRDEGIRYGGSLQMHLTGQRATRTNRGSSDCAVWVALVYFHLCRGTARAFLSLPHASRRRQRDEFEAWIVRRAPRRRSGR